METVNVTPIGQKGITPEVVAEHFAPVAKDLSAVFIIGFRKDGVIVNMGCGSAQEMALASLVLGDISINAARNAFGAQNGTV